LQNFQAVRRNAASQVIGAGAGPLPGVAAVVPGVGAAAAGAAAAAAGGGGGGAGRGEAQRRTFGRLAVGTLMLAVALTIAAAVVETPADIDTCNAEHAYFGIWTSVVLVRVFLGAALTLAVYRAYVPAADVQPPAVQRLLRVREMLSWFGLAWFVVGNTYVGRAGPACTATPLYQLAFAMLVMQYIQLLLPIAILVLLVAAVCCCMPLLIRILVATGAVTSAQHPATTRQIRSLAEEKFHAGRFPPNDSSCAICTEDYAENDAIRVLPCGGSHHFHKACVDNWLHINANCPICRGNVLAGAGPPAPAAGAAAAAAPGAAATSAGGSDNTSGSGADRDAGGPAAVASPGSSPTGAGAGRGHVGGSTDTDGGGIEPGRDHVSVDVDGTAAGGGGSHLSMGSARYGGGSGVRPVSLIIDRSPGHGSGPHNAAGGRGDRADEPLVRGSGSGSAWL
jgi:E3 ubiquitin-protein ligase RNF38/44